jgi:hypothetical protein
MNTWTPATVAQSGELVEVQLELLVPVPVPAVMGERGDRHQRYTLRELLNRLDKLTAEQDAQSDADPLVQG